MSTRLIRRNESARNAGVVEVALDGVIESVVEKDNNLTQPGVAGVCNRNFEERSVACIAVFLKDAALGCHHLHVNLHKNLGFPRKSSLVVC